MRKITADNFDIYALQTKAKNLEKKIMLNIALFSCIRFLIFPLQCD